MTFSTAQSTGVESRLRRYISRVGLLPLAFVVWRTLRNWSPELVRRNRTARQLNAGNLPIPPNSLIFSASTTRDVDWFLESGRQTARAFRSALNTIGRPLESFQSVLDFGCGSGRVIRQWVDVRGPRFTGSDYNGKAIRWDRANLPFARFERNSLAPPLPFEANEFDLCYAVSVFTHLPVELQRAWIEELHRVVRPGGILMLTLSGRGDFKRITAAERESFEAGNLVVVDPKFAGTNMCGAYHPVEYVRREWSDLFEIVAHHPEGAKGAPKQDLFVFRRV
jgi:SAM-dependent methyltransferase